MQIRNGIVTGILKVLGKLKAKEIEADNITGNLDGNASSATTLTGLTATVAELNKLDGVTATTAELNKMDGVTATTAELNYVDGVTSNIQTQLNAKQVTITGGATTITTNNLTASRALVADGNGKVAVSAVTSTELGYLDGVTSNIQTQLNAKQATVTGAATTITTNNLTASRALISDSNGKVAVSAVTSTELGYLDGVTSSIQTQLNNKSATTHIHNYAGSSSAGGVATSAAKLATAVNINGTAFNGTAAITTTNWGTARNITIGSSTKSVNGGAAVSYSANEIGIPSLKDIGTALSTENLNNTTAGNYYSSASTITSALTNPPTTGAGFRLLHFKGYSGDNYDAQIAFNGNNFYGRTESGGTWKEWGTFLTDKNYTSFITKIGTTTKGSATQPIYLNAGVPTACSYTLGKSVPSDAKFTDTTYTLSSFGITATAAELNKMDGVTATTAELNYVDGVTSNIQTQLNAKQATITGGATSIASSNLTASRALVSDSSGKVAVSAVTSTELGYLDGVTSAVQTQLNGKAKGSTISGTTAATAQWYRIASSSSGISNCSGIFTIIGAASGYHTSAIIEAGTSYGNANSTSINVLNCHNYSSASLTKARIVYHTTYSSNYAYLEVYLNAAIATTITVYLSGNIGWSLVSPATVGSIPSGYSNKSVNLSNNTMVAATFSGTASAATYAARLNHSSASPASAAGFHVLHASGSTVGSTADYSVDTPNSYSAAQYGTILRTKYNNSNVYYTDFHINANSADLRYKTVSNGTSLGWIRILDSSNYTTFCASASHSHSVYYDSSISRTANTVLAAPNGSAGGATFRKLVAADLPTVTVAKGGTGATTKKAAEYNLLNGLTTYTTAISDTIPIVCQYAAPDTSQGVLYTRNASYLWNYIKGKSDSTYAAKSHNHAASTITAGTLAGQVVANSSGQTYSTSLLRNSKLVSSVTNPTVNGEITWKYE